jgi:hypothetical protein
VKTKDETVIMMVKPIPLIKEDRIDKIKACLKCIANHPFDRKSQRDCIMELYPGKTEKSVFRGMVIPSLRHLGLVVGYAGGLRVSANAKIIIDSENIEPDLHLRCLRAVMCEIDKTKFGFIDMLIEDTHISLANLTQTLVSSLHTPDTRARERIVSWLSILQQVGLVKSIAPELLLNEGNRKKAAQDLDISSLDSEEFRKTMFEEHVKLAKGTAGIVDITDLRTSVASAMLNKKHKIVTESMFDNLLRSMSLVTEDYLISFGRPMGAEEKLFRYKEDYYRTISIAYLKD